MPIRQASLCLDPSSYKDFIIRHPPSFFFHDLDIFHVSAPFELDLHKSPQHPDSYHITNFNSQPRNSTLQKIWALVGLDSAIRIAVTIANARLRPNYFMMVSSKSKTLFAHCVLANFLTGFASINEKYILALGLLTVAVVMVMIKHKSRLEQRREALRDSKSLADDAFTGNVPQYQGV